MKHGCCALALGAILQGCNGFGLGLSSRPSAVMLQHGTRTSGVKRTRAWGPSMTTTAATTAEAVDLSGDGGVTRQMVQEGKGKGLITGDIATVKFTGTVVETGQIFSKGDEFRTTLEDGTMISGWDTGLAGLKVGDRAIIRCTSRYGYGDEGVTPIIPPGANLVFDVEIRENEGNIMNPATFVDTNPLTPRSPQSIADAFDMRTQRKKEEIARQEELEGLDKVIAWVKSIYIFGLFEGETGQEAPWYLKPVITFPIMIGICGAAFYIVLLLNGISTQRTAGVQDDPMLASLGLEALRQLNEMVA